MLKRVLLGLANRCGASSAIRRVTTRRHPLLTLCYHSVLPRDRIGSSFLYRNTVSVEEFQSQLETLASWFQFATPDAVLAAAHGQPIEQPSALITFDDGHRNLLHHAAPVLERMGIPAIMHLTTGHIGTDRPLWTEELAWLVMGWQPSELPMPGRRTAVALEPPTAARTELARRVGFLCKQLPDADREAYIQQLRSGPSSPPAVAEREAFRFLDWNDVTALHRRGFTIGSHTVAHSLLTRVGAHRLDHELCSSKHELETRLHTECPWIAYPNGGPSDVSPTVLERAGAAGYRVGFTTFGGFADPRVEPLAIGRITIPGGLRPGAFRAMVSGVHRALDCIKPRGR